MVKDFRQGLTEAHLFTFGKTPHCVLENGWWSGGGDEFGGLQ